MVPLNTTQTLFDYYKKLKANWEEIKGEVIENVKYCDFEAIADFLKLNPKESQIFHQNISFLKPLIRYDKNRGYFLSEIETFDHKPSLLKMKIPVDPNVEIESRLEMDEYYVQNYMVYFCLDCKRFSALTNFCSYYKTTMSKYTPFCSRGKISRSKMFHPDKFL